MKKLFMLIIFMNVLLTGSLFSQTNNNFIEKNFQVESAGYLAMDLGLFFPVSLGLSMELSDSNSPSQFISFQCLDTGTVNKSFNNFKKQLRVYSSHVFDEKSALLENYEITLSEQKFSDEALQKINQIKQSLVNSKSSQISDFYISCVVLVDSMREYFISSSTGSAASNSKNLNFKIRDGKVVSLSWE